MRILSTLVLLAAACAIFAPNAPYAVAEQSAPPAAEVITAVKATLAAARKATKGDSDTMKALKAARASLEPSAAWAKAATGTNGLQFAVVWNELLTVSAYHGVPGKLEYMVTKSEILWSRYVIGLPTGSSWLWKNNGASNNDQLHMFVWQVRANGEKMREMKVWTYRWDTVYSGVGGENSKGLAKMMHEVDRDSTAKSGRKVSPAVVPKRMNSEFDRANYYFVEGFDVDLEKNVRRDNYYLKGQNCSFNFEIITYKDAGKDDDAVTKWQLTDDCPEAKAMLESIASNPNYKK